MPMMILVTATFIAVLVYEAVPMIRQGLWADLVVVCLLWLLGFSLAASQVLGIEVSSPSDAILRASRLFAGVRDFLLPGVTLFR